MPKKHSDALEKFWDANKVKHNVACHPCGITHPMCGDCLNKAFTVARPVAVNGKYGQAACPLPLVLGTTPS